MSDREQKKDPKELDLLISALGETSELDEAALDAAMRARGVDPDATVSALLEVVARHRKSSRLAWMQESRAAFVSGRLNGFGAGGALSGLIPIGSRIAIETGAAVSLFQFGPAEFPGTYDADGQSYASVYGFRLGLRYHIE